jgi:hypothetical protein
VTVQLPSVPDKPPPSTTRPPSGFTQQPVTGGQKPPVANQPANRVGSSLGALPHPENGPTTPSHTPGTVTRAKKLERQFGAGIKRKTPPTTPIKQGLAGAPIKRPGRSPPDRPPVGEPPNANSTVLVSPETAPNPVPDVIVLVTLPVFWSAPKIINTKLNHLNSEMTVLDVKNMLEQNKCGLKAVEMRLTIGRVVMRNSQKLGSFPDMELLRATKMSS